MDNPLFQLFKMLFFPEFYEKHVLTDCETYCLAFKNGAKIMLDVLTDGPMKEI